MDDVDMIQDREALAGPSRIAAYRMTNGPESTGKCLWCDSPLDLRRWCDNDCMTDWQKQQRADAQRPTP